MKSMNSGGGEIGVTSKTYPEQVHHHNNNQVVVVELGLKLQNQNRPFLCNQRNNTMKGGDDENDDDDGDGDGGGGPTSCNGYNVMNIYDDVAAAAAGDFSSSVHSTAAAGLVKGLQPFDVSLSPSYPFFKPSGGMATAAVGFPFTAAQWKELERQAMIYKYMMASLPVPPDLLYSFSTNLSPSNSFAPASYLLGRYGEGLNLRWSGNNKDAEPGRCRRTDGKKWRCSRDVAPNQKYCERHMHRGRPRSRKPVEQLLHPHHHHSLSSDSSINTKSKTNASTTTTTITTNNNNQKKTRLNDPNPNPNPNPNPQSLLGSSYTSVQQPSKASTFGDTLVSGANPFEDSRNLAWTEEQQWHQLVQTNMNSPSFQHQFEGELLNLNSHADFNPKSGLGLLERPLIDAWSMGGITGNKNNGGSNKSSLTSSPNGAHGNVIDEEMCQIHMGLGVGLIDPWATSHTTPGGPLAEVLRPGSITAAARSAIEGDFVTPPATAVSSPSGVLQKTLASFSDSSGSNSPTTCDHHSKAKSDMPFHWLN